MRHLCRFFKFTIDFNVKGCDLLAMDEEPDSGISESLKQAYAELGLEAKPLALSPTSGDFQTLPKNYPLPFE